MTMIRHELKQAWKALLIWTLSIGAFIVICLFIFKVSYDIFRDAIDRMVDRSCDEETEEKMRVCAQGIDGVMNVDLLRTRVFGNKIYVDIEIGVDGGLSLRKAHQISENVHSAVENTFPDVKHIMVHVNPNGEDTINNNENDESEEPPADGE